MGMEHERIHLETSSVLIRQLPVEMVEQPRGWAYAPLSSGEIVCLWKKGMRRDHIGARH